MRRLTLVLAPLLLAAVLAPPSARAQQRSMTLAEALQAAERNAPNVVQAMGNARAAGAGVRAAWGEFLPRVSSNASYGSSFSEIPSRTDPITGQVISGGTSSQSLSMGGTAAIDLFTGFRRGADLNSARAGRTDADAAYAAEKAQSALNTTLQFLQALQSQALVRVRQDAIQRAEDKLAIANAKLATRAATIADSLQAVVDLTSARVALLGEQRNQTEAEAGLARLVGRDGRVTATEDSSLFRMVAVPDAASLMTEATERSPAMIRATARVRTARANLSISKAPYFPSVTLSAGSSFSGSNSNDFALLNNRNISVALSWQLFNGFNREFNVSRQSAALDAALATEADTRRDIGSRLTTQLAALDLASERMTLTARSLDAARASARVQTERYRLGSIGIVELNAAQDAFSRAENDAVSARFDYLRAKAQIEAILGRMM